jgi:hypothetical protein
MYAVVVVDRHSDPDVTLFRTEKAAFQAAESWADEWSKDWRKEYPEDYADCNDLEVGETGGLTYSSEGDYIFVAEVEEPE